MFDFNYYILIDDILINIVFTSESIILKNKRIIDLIYATSNFFFFYNIL